jgi:hypothetical protein
MKMLSYLSTRIVNVPLTNEKYTLLLATMPSFTLINWGIVIWPLALIVEVNGMIDLDLYIKIYFGGLSLIPGCKSIAHMPSTS